MIELRQYQKEAEWAIFDYFVKGGVGNPIVAMPTGTGKSLVIASFIRTVLRCWTNQRIMMLTHVKELIEQNAKALYKLWETAPIGIHSAGLNSREILHPIIFGGVQSVFKTIKKVLNDPNSTPGDKLHFGKIDLILIDEAHLLSPSEDTMYQFVISELQKTNPYLKVIGFTATPYRLKQGMITEDGLFTDVCFDITTMSAFNRLIAEGYISTLIPRPTKIEIDLSSVQLSAGDYNGKQLQEAVDKDEITYSAVTEIVEYGHDRKSWLIFASGIKNSENIASMLQSFGISATSTHSKIESSENTKRINDFKLGRYQAIVNANKLTTGFDHPPIDLIGMLRPTLSPGLWVQMLGRGTRICEGKSNCLVLDFAGNTKRLGPINDPVKPRKPGKQGEGEVPIKICENCGTYNHASVRTCIYCGFEFKIKNKLFKTSSSSELIRCEMPVVSYFSVTKVIYNLHEKKDSSGNLTSPPSIKVSYFCQENEHSLPRMFNKYVCLEHSGIIGKQARDWWRECHGEEPPVTTCLALQRVNEIKIPKKVRVWTNKKFPEVLSYEW